MTIHDCFPPCAIVSSDCIPLLGFPFKSKSRYPWVFSIPFDLDHIYSWPQNLNHSTSYFRSSLFSRRLIRYSSSVLRSASFISHLAIHYMRFDWYQHMRDSKEELRRNLRLYKITIFTTSTRLSAVRMVFLRKITIFTSSTRFSAVRMVFLRKKKTGLTETSFPSSLTSKKKTIFAGCADILAPSPLLTCVHCLSSACVLLTYPNSANSFQCFSRKIYIANIDNYFPNESLSCSSFAHFLRFFPRLLFRPSYSWLS